MFQGSKNLAYLDLRENKTTKIEKGAFEDSENLCRLLLSSNPIRKLEKGALHGLQKHESCRVNLKGVPIEMIHGGVFAKYR